MAAACLLACLLAGSAAAYLAKQSVDDTGRSVCGPACLPVGVGRASLGVLGTSNDCCKIHWLSELLLLLLCCPVAAAAALLSGGIWFCGTQVEPMLGSS